MFDFYKNSLESVMDSKIDNGVSGKNNLLQLLKLNILIFQSKKVVLLLS